MAGQPLAWMEASNLPEEAYGISSLISVYREVMNTMHEGVILPIGEEPSGRSWTGFQSLSDERSGYILVFREADPEESSEVRTWLPEGTRAVFEPVAGDGKKFRATAGDDGRVRFALPEENSFALYRYEVR